MMFSDAERGLLLETNGIGPEVVKRLEEAGFHSLEHMRRVGVDCVIQAMCSYVGSGAWANRRRALQRALDADSHSREAVLTAPPWQGATRVAGIGQRT